MGLLDDVIRDARRPLPGRHATSADGLRIQREALPDDEPVSVGDAAASPAMPIEEQDDGSWTLYRFQEAPAGRVATPPVAQVPAGGGPVRERVAGTPFETDPPPAQDGPVEARPGVQHPTGVRAGGIAEVSVETAVMETREQNPETDASDFPVRTTYRSSERQAPMGSFTASSGKSRVSSSADDALRSDLSRRSRQVESFEADRVEGQRRPPGPGAPPEPLNGKHRPSDEAGQLPDAGQVNDAGQLNDADLRHDSAAAGPARTDATPRSVTAFSPGNRAQHPAGREPDGGVHIGLLEVQVINAEEPARPAAPSPRQDVARRRYWKRY